MKDLWVIGDKFLLDIYGELSRIRADAIISKEPVPYVHDFYNVQFFTANPLSEITNIMTRMVNSLVKALNEVKVLPRIILVIPDDNILHQVGKLNPSTDALIVIEKAVNWMLTQMERAISSKKEYLRKRKPGAVTSGEPKVIWVKMLKRYNACNNLMQIRNMFNDTVEKCMLDKSAHYIIDICEKLSDPCYFMPAEPYDLTNDGKTRFWKELDMLLESFDHQKISLKPRRMEQTEKEFGKKHKPQFRKTNHKYRWNVWNKSN